MACPPLIEALRDGRRYPHPASEVQVAETHASWVLLAGTFAYKIKKPVTLPFLDYGSLEKRRAACLEELRLNRRLAPDLYQDVVAIAGSPEAPMIGGEGEAIEYAVRMVRFPEAMRLDHVARRGELGPTPLTRLARAVGGFHEAATVAPPGPGHGEPARVIAPALENFTELYDLAPGEQPRLATLEAWTRAEFTRIAPLLAGRKAAGRIRECHGDLHLGNLVLMGDEVVPFDGIEFSEDLRWIDVANEIAFTWVDLLDHGRPDLAGWFLNEWLGWSGDYGALGALRFYAVYRALVRAKVAGLRGDAGEIADYLALAESLVRPPLPRLVITFGLSGSGKTTESGRLLMADPAASTIRLRSDVERKRLFGLAPDEASGGAIYAPEANDRTYARLLDLAGQAIIAGWSVVVDAAFLRRAERAAFRRLAAGRDLPFRILACDAPLEELRRRTTQRAGDASEATAAVVDLQAGWVEPLSDAERALVLPAPRAPLPGG
ncbi:MAG: AAA family ATPase [Rhodocyclaceae bacterium]|nr:AAA family ATPase [Rhodocyclaceae bacterium]